MDDQTPPVEETQVIQSEGDPKGPPGPVGLPGIKYDGGDIPTAPTAPDSAIDE